MKTTDLIFDRSYVDGKWTTEGEASFEVFNPATGEKIKTVADGGIAITEKAIDAADSAFKPWRKTTAKYRAELLEKWHNLMLENTAQLAEIMTLECGKPFTESKGEVAYGAAFVKWFAEEGKRTYLEVENTVDHDIIVCIRDQNKKYLNHVYIRNNDKYIFTGLPISRIFVQYKSKEFFFEDKSFTVINFGERHNFSFFFDASKEGNFIIISEKEFFKP